jgi:transcription elongation GreA/GreB family factor
VEMLDLETVIYKLQRTLNDRLQNIGDTMISGGVDNMEKYRYLLGQAQAIQITIQDISNLLENKEQKDEQRSTENVVQFGHRSTED